MIQEIAPHATAKRDHILETSRRLFLNRGYAGTSMDLITGEAGILGYLDDLIIVPFGIALALKMISRPVSKTTE